jgi:hypothetical protein
MCTQLMRLFGCVCATSAPQVLTIFALGILLMTLPAELLSYKAPEKAELNLATTFSTLSSQGYLSLVFILLGFVLMVFDVVGGETVMEGAVDYPVDRSKRASRRQLHASRLFTRNNHAPLPSHYCS